MEVKASAESSSGSAEIIDIPLIERVALDPEAAFAGCLIEGTANGRALFVRKKDDASGPKASCGDGSDSYRISNTVAVLGPPSLLKRRVIDLLLRPPPPAATPSATHATPSQP